MSEKEEIKEDVTPKPKKKGVKFSTIRGFVCALVFVAVGIGLALHTGTGTVSSFGLDYISTLCPLGALEAMLGEHAFILRAAIVLVIVLLVILLVGKAFCGWICPIPHISNFFQGKKTKEKNIADRNASAELATQRWKGGETVEHKTVQLDSRHGVLLGALLSTAVFGFPVFCLVCPVGLTFATFIAAWRILQFNELTWGIIVFPLIIVLEVVIFRKWCGTLCPLGALMSLVSSWNKTIKPNVDHSKCLRDVDGTACRACDAACPEHLDPHSNLADRPMSECIKCGSCIDACPAKAIAMKLTSGFNKKETETHTE